MPKLLFNHTIPITIGDKFVINNEQYPEGQLTCTRILFKFQKSQDLIFWNDRESAPRNMCIRIDD